MTRYEARINRQQAKLRKPKVQHFLALAGLVVTAIAIIAISVSTYKDAQAANLMSYQQSECQLYSNSNSTDFWYECPVAGDAKIPVAHQ